MSITGPKSESRHASAHELAAGYSPIFRKVEIASITTYFALAAALAFKLSAHATARPWLLIAAAVSGYIAADFVSGFVHWLADTWGTSQTPVLGKSLVRPFREHHVDPKAITRHDFIETNGANCLVSLPGFAIALAVPLDQGEWQGVRLFVVAFFASLVLFVMATNQIHKWSHDDAPPKLIVALQKLHLVLPVDHHSVHHTAPYDRYYCITTGWLNWPLHRLGFFRTMERAVTATLGWIPREDDIGLAAALEAAPSVTTPPGAAGPHAAQQP